MKYELRHNNDIIIHFEIDETFKTEKINEITNKDKVPIGLYLNNGINKNSFDDWISSRTIPAKRESLDIILDKENVENVRELFFKNNGLSLTDHYWVAEADSPLKWEEINYFDNDDSFDKFGDDIYLGFSVENIDQGRTPSSSASGMQPKKWILYNGERWMLKNSEEVSKQEPYSECAASVILDKLGINHVKYEVFKRNKDFVSGCPNMLDNKSELISAWYTTRDKKGNNESYLDHYIRRCKELEVEGDIKTPLDQMIVIDYLFANTDRHWSNFSIIRNADTLKGERLAPLYDHGAAFYTKLHHLDMPDRNNNLECKSFKKTQKENIKLVKNIDWLKKDVLSEIPDIIKTIMNKNKYSSPERTDTIVSCINKRIIDFKREFDIPVSPKPIQTQATGIKR